MTTKISLFNHKGGVSKTTTAFNLGWMIASKGKRVLLVDCDPQYNLTGMVLKFKGITDLNAFYKTDAARNIKDGLPAPDELGSRSVLRGHFNGRGLASSCLSTDWCSAVGMFFRLASSCLRVTTDLGVTGFLAMIRNESRCGGPVELCEFDLPRQAV